MRLAAPLVAAVALVAAAGAAEGQGPGFAYGVAQADALIRAGAVFKNGKLVERPDGQPAVEAAA